MSSSVRSDLFTSLEVKFFMPCVATFVPTKSDSDVIFCLQVNLYTPLELTRIVISLVY